MLKNGLALLLWVALPLGVGLAGAAVTNPGGWYESLIKPSWTPPNWLFPIAWTTLYVLMGIAAFLIWRRAGDRPVAVPLILFIVQLAVNAAWSPLFFALHRPDWALLDIVLLWVLVLATLIAFARVRLVAGMLLVPYLVWVSYATALNFTLWQWNPLS